MSNSATLNLSLVICSVLFCLQRFWYLQHTSLIYSARFFNLGVLLLVVAFAFVCSVSFRFAACLSSAVSTDNFAASDPGAVR